MSEITVTELGRRSPAAQNAQKLEEETEQTSLASDTGAVLTGLSEAFQAPSSEQLDVANSSVRRTRLRLLQAFREFAQSYIAGETGLTQEPTEESEDSSDVADQEEGPSEITLDVPPEILKEATSQMRGEIRDTRNLPEMRSLLLRYIGEDQVADSVGKIFENLAVVNDFQDRVGRGFRPSDTPGQGPSDHRGQSYQLVLSSLKSLPAGIKEATPELREIFQKVCNSFVTERLKEVNKLADAVEVEQDEEVVQGAGKNLQDLLAEQKEQLARKAAAGGKLFMHFVTIPISGLGWLAGKGIGAVKSLFSLFGDMAGRLGLNERLNDLRGSLAEAEEREGSGRRFKLPFDLSIPIPSFPSWGRGAGNEVEPDEPKMGLKGAARRKSQVGIKPLYDDDDRLIEFSGTPGTLLEKLLNSTKSKERARKSKIRGELLEYSAHLHNTDAWVVTGKDGSLTRLDVFLKESMARHRADTAPRFKELYPERSVENIDLNEGEATLGPGQTEITARIYPGMTLTLPLAPEYSVRGLTFLGKRNKPIVPKEDWKIREGLFGSFLVKSPSNARYVRFIVSKKTDEERKVSDDLQRRLRNVLPKLQSYQEPEERVFRRALETLPDSDDRSKLWYKAQQQAGFIYTMDPFLSRYQKRSGTARSEAIAGTRMGICDSFSFYIAQEANSFGAPAIVVSGPIVKGSKFQRDPEHAVAAVVHKEGIEQLDLTRHAKSDSNVSRWKLKRSGRKEILSDLRSDELTNRSVYETAEDLHYLLQGEQPPWSGKEDEKQELSVVGRALNRFDRYSDNRTGHRPKLEAEGYENTDELKAKHKSVQALTQKWYLAELYRKAGEEDSLAPLYRYFTERGSKSGPSKLELKLLPPAYEELKYFNGHAEVVEYSHRAILLDGVGEQAQQDAISWVLSESKPERKKSELDRERWMNKLGPKLFSSFFEPDLLRQLNDEQFLELHKNFRITASNAFVARGTHSSGERWTVTSQMVRNLEPDRYPLVQRALMASATEMKRRGLTLDVYEAVNSAACMLNVGSLCTLDSDLKDQKQEFAQRALDTFSTIEQAAKLPEGSLLTKLLGTSFEGHNFGAQFEHLCKAAGNEVLRDRDISVAVAGEMERAGAELKQWEVLHYWAKRLGIEIDLSGATDRLAPALLDGIQAKQKEISSDKLSPKPINWPSDDNPGSAIMARIGPGANAKLWRTADALLAMGAISSEEAVRQIWPSTDEDRVVKLVMNRLYTPYSFDHDLQLRDKGGFSMKVVPEYATRFGECPNLHKILLADRVGYEPIMEIAERRSPSMSEVNRYFGLISKNFTHVFDEESAKSWREAKQHHAVPLAVQMTVKRLFKDIEPKDAYHAALYIGAMNLGRRPATESHHDTRPAIISSVAELNELRDAIAAGPEEISKLLEARGYAGSLRSRLFDDLGPEAKALTLAAGSLIKADEAKLLAVGAGPFPIPAAHGLSVNVDEVESDRLRQLWSEITPVGRTEVFDAAYERAKKGVSLATAPGMPKFQAPYSRYLLGEKAPVRPRSSSGEFEEFREYKPGDDPRRIDSKASARTEKLLMRKYREREYRPVKLVVDPEWLYESVDENGGKQSALNDLRIEQLFTHILLAEKEGVPLDLVILSRGGAQVHTRLDKSGKLHESDFRIGLARELSRLKDVVEEEESLYAGTHIGGYNLVAHAGEYISKGDLAVCLFSRNNMLYSAPGLNALERRGSFIHTPPGDGIRKGDFPRLHEARQKRIELEKQEERRRESRRRPRSTLSYY